MSTHRMSSTPGLRTAVLAGVAAVVLTSGAADAAAVEGSAGAAVNKTTRAIDREWNDGKVRAQSSVRTRVVGGQATLTDRRGHTLRVSIGGMRKDVNARNIEGTTVFSNALGKGIDAAVQRTPTGVRLLSVIRSASAPTAYRYPLRLPRGATLERQSSGVILIRDAAGMPLGAVRAPWAIDARGAKVATRFEVRGRTLVQHVAHVGAAYPVVADPSIDFGLTSATITLNAQDQRIILSGGGEAAGGLLGLLICSGSGPGAALCAVGGAVIGSMVFEAIKEYLVRENCDLKVKIAYLPPQVQDVKTECH